MFLLQSVPYTNLKEQRQEQLVNIWFSQPEPHYSPTLSVDTDL